MAGVLRRSLRLFKNLLKKDRLQQELKKRMVEHDQQFLKNVINPTHADGRYHRMYQESRAKVLEWYNQEMKNL